MPDMLVKLYQLNEDDTAKRLRQKGINIKRALIPDKNKIVDFVRSNFGEGWVGECEYALFNNPPSCYVAVKDKEIIGFACYDATAKGLFGPIGVKETIRHEGVGRALLFSCLHSMKEIGYAYAVIGWVSEATDFYKKAVNATVIEDSPPSKSIYSNLIHIV